MPAVPRAQRLAILAVCALVVFAAGFAHAGSREPEAAPPFTLRTAHGSVSLDSLRGQVVLVDFWASWCGPCHRSFPWLASMHRKYGDHGLRIVAVNLDKDASAAAAFLAGTEAPFTVAYDPAGKVAEAFHVRGMPTSVLVGRDGRVIDSHIGFDPAKAEKFESLIQEACTR
jgi:cytochrome c biogenesis protein CcmG/thiol:disulfide interchange protein DsbE